MIKENGSRAALAHKICYSGQDNPDGQHLEGKRMQSSNYALKAIALNPAL